MKIFVPMMGRLGNRMFMYSYGRAFCEFTKNTLCTDAWIGEEVFNIGAADRTPKDSCEMALPEHYRQDQQSLIYTRAQVREWFTLRPEIADQLANLPGIADVVAHHRAGDYLDLGYPVVSRESYREACAKTGTDPALLMFVSEEHPVTIPGLPDWLPDFVRLMRAKVLFRGNSSFSWWSATLSDAEVWSPVVNGLGAGVHHGVRFVSGNHPRFCSLSFVTDLFLK